MSNQVKSKARVTDFGEVNTSEREVNAMLDLVKQETERLDSRFLEPACGDGNFLIEVLNRKLEILVKEFKNIPIEDKTVVIQGLGNVGYHAAKFLSEEDGAKITGIIEKDGAITNRAGLPVEAVRAYLSEHDGVEGFPDADYDPNGRAYLELECDILIPAAMEGVINQHNAPRIRTPLIVEAV